MRHFGPNTRDELSVFNDKCYLIFLREEVVWDGLYARRLINFTNASELAVRTVELGRIAEKKGVPTRGLPKKSDRPHYDIFYLAKTTNQPLSQASA